MDSMHSTVSASISKRFARDDTEPIPEPERDALVHKIIERNKIERKKKAVDETKLKVKKTKKIREKKQRKGTKAEDRV